MNFQVENMRVGERTDFDKLRLEIETDGTLTPQEAFSQACDILLSHFTLVSGKDSSLIDGEGANNADQTPKEKPKKKEVKPKKKSKK